MWSNSFYALLNDSSIHCKNNLPVTWLQNHLSLWTYVSHCAPLLSAFPSSLYFSPQCISSQFISSCSSSSQAWTLCESPSVIFYTLVPLGGRKPPETHSSGSKWNTVNVSSVCLPEPWMRRVSRQIPLPLALPRSFYLILVWAVVTTFPLALRSLHDIGLPPRFFSTSSLALSSVKARFLFWHSVKIAICCTKLFFLLLHC